MMEKEKIKKYMLYEIDGDITVKECIKNEILLLFFSALSIYLGMGNIIFIILNIVPIVVYSISIFKLKDEYIIEGVYYILHNGIFAVCVSYIFAIISLELASCSFDGVERNLMICIMVLGYVVFILLYRHIIRKNIKKNVYGGEKEKIKGAPFFAAFAVLGIIVSRIFFKNMDERSATKVACILCFFMSYIFLIGIFSILKYKYLMEHKELLEGLDADTKAKKTKTGENYKSKKSKRKHQSHGRH